MTFKPPFQRVLIIGDPRTIPTSLYRVSRTWFAVAKPEELTGCTLPLEDVLALNFPPEFNINAYDSHIEDIAAWMSQLVQTHGSFDRIVAPTEYTIQIGSRLRARFGVPGWTPELADRVRDKGVMKARVKAAGIATAEFLDPAVISDSAEIAAWIATRPGRLVLKPKTQAGSRGLHIFDDAKSLNATLAAMPIEVRNCHLVEDFLPWPLLHIDGLVRNGKLRFVAGSRYLAPCLSWLADGSAMGSVLLTQPEMLRRIVEFAQELVQALGLEDLVFHLEAFFDGTSLHFLEIAGRPGGAAIVPHLRSQYGIDLQAEMIRCDLGLPAGSDAVGQLQADTIPRCGGWIATQMPTSAACKVTGMLGLDDLPSSVFDADLPKIGAYFNLHGDEGLPSGRFHVRTVSESETEAALSAIAERYKLLVKILDPAPK